MQGTKHKTVSESMSSKSSGRGRDSLNYLKYKERLSSEKACYVLGSYYLIFILFLVENCLECCI